jgi:transposase
MEDEFQIQIERINDIPLLIFISKKLGIDQAINRHAGTHLRQKGINNGQLIIGWLAFLMTEGDHCKVGVQDWSQHLTITLSALLGHPISPNEFCDNRLSRLLDRLSRDSVWEAIEADLWKTTIEVYDLPVPGVRLDSTSSCGYHEIKENGIMQFGQSKDHRPDLPQLKIMAAVVEGCGHLIGMDVEPGNKADDPLYLPLIDRVRSMLNISGLLYSGDCKMAAAAIRSSITSHGDYYLVPLPKTGAQGKLLESKVNEIYAGGIGMVPIYSKGEPFGYGYEIEREMKVNGTKWQERILVVRSLALAKQKQSTLDRNLQKAIMEIKSLTPDPGRGKRQIKDQEILDSKIQAIMNKRGVNGLLRVNYHEKQEEVKRRKNPGRPKKDDEQTIEIKQRYIIDEVMLEKEAIDQKKLILGWRAFVTNLPVKKLSISQAVLHYKEGWTVERGFHLLKGRPIGIRPIFVRKDSQIKGLTRLLSLGLRIMTFIEILVRHKLKEQNKKVRGFYRGQPSRVTLKPTAHRILDSISRSNINLSRVHIDDRQHWNVTDIPEEIQFVLDLMDFPKKLYTSEYYRDAFL